MADRAKPPVTYRAFVERFPELGAAWEQARAAEAATPFDEPTRRLLKLAVAAGTLRPGAVHSAVRKARAAGASDEQIYAVVALAASTLGFPSAVAVFSWVADELDGR